LTEDRRSFLKDARAILPSSREAKRRTALIARGAAGLLEIQFTGSAPFNPLVSPLSLGVHRQLLGVRLTLNRMTSAQLEAPHDGRVDVGFACPAMSELLLRHSRPARTAARGGLARSSASWPQPYRA
jgi:DNA-binding transcriptional LysR family regulator